MTKFSLSGQMRPAYALFAKDYEASGPFCQAVVPQEAEEVELPSAGG
jgi:hypothetical protein